MTAAGGPLSKVFNCIPSFINIANERRGVMVGFSQKASIWRGDLPESTNDCALLYSMTVVLAD